MLPTAEVVTAVVFDGGVAEALARGAVWAQMGTIGLTATAEIGAGSAGSGPTCCSWTRRCRAARAPPRPGSCSSWPPARPPRCGRRPGVRGDGPPDRVAGRGRPGQPDEAGRQRLHVDPHRGRGRGAGAGRPSWASRRPSWPRPSRAARWTRPSPRPSCTRWSGVTSRPSSRWSGRSRTWTWPSARPATTRCRCWPRCPASGGQRWTRATAGKTSARPGWP